MGKKEEKQFPLTSKNNCIIYLNRIISSCEKCMDRLKSYNKEGERLLLKYQGNDVVSYEVYANLMDKASNVENYLLNLLGDAQSSSISYFKFRNVVSKRPVADVKLAPLDSEVKNLLDDFNRMRNWQNHVPESLLVAEMERVKYGEMFFPQDPVEIINYRTVSYAYFNNMIEINKNFYKAARKIIQVAKKDYSNIYGKSVMYSRVYTDQPLDLDKSIPAQKSAKVQGIKGNLLVQGHENKNKNP